MKMLAFEFSSPQRSVAIVDGGVASEVVETAHGQAMKPLAMVEQALRQAGLEREQMECIAVGLGPGSYTGIRAAIALAQGWQLAFGADRLKLLGVSSAEAVAAQAATEGITGNASVVIDAQRGEFYTAGYELGGSHWQETAPLRIVGRAEVVARESAGELLIGPEVAKWFPAGRLIFPRAEMVARLAATRRDFVSGEQLEPIYLRETSFVKAPPPRVV